MTEQTVLSYAQRQVLAAKALSDALRKPLPASPFTTAPPLRNPVPVPFTPPESE